MNSYGFAVLVILIILFVVCFFIANMMVKKRCLLANRFLIGKDSSEIIDHLTKVAIAALSGEVIISKEGTVSIEVTTLNNEVSQAKVENEKTIVIVCKNGDKEIIHKGFTELGAAFAISFTLFAIITLVSFFLAIIIWLIWSTN